MVQLVEAATEGQGCRVPVGRLPWRRRRWRRRRGLCRLLERRMPQPSVRLLRRMPAQDVSTMGTLRPLRVGGRMLLSCWWRPEQHLMRACRLGLCVVQCHERMDKLLRRVCRQRTVVRMLID